jgi:ribosomal protein L29
MATESSDPITAAMIETEKEVAGFAWGDEDTEASDPSGDRSLEGMGDGLEGQHEAEDDAEADGEDADGDAETEAAAAEAEAAAALAAAEAGKKPPVAAEPPEGGRVPSGKLREANEARRAAEAERDALKAQIEKGGETKALADKLDLALREIDNLKRAPRTEARAPEPPKAEVIPDIFEDPKGFRDHLTKEFQTELSNTRAQLANQRVETSMAIAHAIHKDVFADAFAAINKLNVENPEDRVTVQRIYNSPNPGEALVGWHKRQQTLSEVGDDPAAYRARIAKETREALAKDPEFRKQLVAELRGEANVGDDGNPRTTTRLPRSLARAQGSNVGSDRGAADAGDGSPQAIANSAWS